METNLAASVAAFHSCPTCLFSFKKKKALRQHRCLVKLCSPGESPDLFLRDEGELSRLSKSVGMFRSSVSQIFKFCQTTKTVMPGLFPLFFCPQGQNSLPILSKIGCVSDSYGLLRTAAQEGPVRIPRSLNIQVGGNLLKVDSDLLMPKSNQHMHGFTIIENHSHFIILKKVSNRAGVSLSQFVAGLWEF
jgi:hypothetical protein